MSEGRRVAGWYDDERDAATLRYWDGASWTPHTTARPEPEVASASVATAVAGTVSLGVTEVRSSGVRGAPARGASARDGIGSSRPSSHPVSSPHAGSMTPVPVDTLVDDFSISEMTSARSAAKPSVTPVAASAAPIAMAPPTFAAAPSFAASPAPAHPASFTQAPATPNEHTTVPLPPTGFVAASAHRPAAGGGRSPDGAGRSFLVVWLLALLLGSLGADRFALGKPGTAVAKLLTAGGFGVWTLVDLVLVLTGAQHDRDGHPLAGFETHRRLAWIVSGAVVGLGVLLGVVAGFASMSLAASLGQVGAL